MKNIDLIKKLDLDMKDIVDSKKKIIKKMNEIDSEFLSFLNLEIDGLNDILLTFAMYLTIKDKGLQNHMFDDPVTH